MTDAISSAQSALSALTTSMAATPPMGNPYPQWMSGMAKDHPTIAAIASRMAAERAGLQVLAAKIQDELKAYEVGFDLESMPQDQAEQLEPSVDNLPQAAGGIHTLRVSDGVVEAETDYPDDEQGAETGKLICGAIMRAAEPGEGDGSRVLGEDDAVLAECEPDDADFP